MERGWERETEEKVERERGMQRNAERTGEGLKELQGVQVHVSGQERLKKGERY